MKFNGLLTNCYLVNPLWDFPEKKDILLMDGRIEKIGTNLKRSRLPIIDLHGKYISPGFIDLQSQICSALQNIQSSIELGSKAGLKGGFTTLCATSHHELPLDNEGIIGLIKALANSKGYTKIIPSACATKNLLGEELAEIGILYESGAGLIYDTGKTIKSSNLVRRLMEYSKMFPIPLLLHCEDTNLSQGGLMHEGLNSTRLGLPGIPSTAEQVIVSRDLLLAEYSQVPIVLTHLTCKESVKLVENAKSKNLDIHATVTPHHLFFTDADIDGYNNQLKVFPPFREEVDREALIQGLQNGVIDCIASDHTQSKGSDRRVEFANAPSGIQSLEYCFQICFERLVKTGILSLSELVQKLSLNPAKILGINGGIIKEGVVADLVVLDLDHPSYLEHENPINEIKQSPYGKQHFSSRIFATFVEGELRYHDNKFMRKEDI